MLGLKLPTDPRWVNIVEKNIEEKLKFNNSSKPKQDVKINDDKKMDVQNGYVIIDDQKIEGAMCQETDYNSDD